PYGESGPTQRFERADDATGRRTAVRKQELVKYEGEERQEGAAKCLGAPHRRHSDDDELQSLERLRVARKLLAQGDAEHEEVTPHEAERAERRIEKVVRRPAEQPNRQHHRQREQAAATRAKAHSQQGVEDDEVHDAEDTEDRRHPLVTHRHQPELEEECQEVDDTDAILAVDVHERPSAPEKRGGWAEGGT